MDAMLSEIERALDEGTYRPGPWARFLEHARACSDEERAAVAERVSAISARLHGEQARIRLPVSLALGLEVAGVVMGAACASAAGGIDSSLLAFSAASMWASTFQPLIKVGVGRALGVTYEHAYLWRLEPRFKMAYGSYLARPRWQRIGLHLAGSLGAALGSALAADRVRRRSPRAARICDYTTALMVGSNLLFFCGGLLGRKRLLGIPVTASSGGSAGLEIREALQQP